MKNYFDYASVLCNLSQFILTYTFIVLIRTLNINFMISVCIIEFFFSCIFLVNTLINVSEISCINCIYWYQIKENSL